MGCSFREEQVGRQYFLAESRYVFAEINANRNWGTQPKKEASYCVQVDERSSLIVATVSDVMWREYSGVRSSFCSRSRATKPDDVIVLGKYGDVQNRRVCFNPLVVIRAKVAKFVIEIVFLFRQTGQLDRQAEEKLPYPSTSPDAALAIDTSVGLIQTVPGPQRKRALSCHLLSDDALRSRSLQRRRHASLQPGEVLVRLCPPRCQERSNRVGEA